jgi:tetratricopeptide (TPR) repeat protein
MAGALAVIALVIPLGSRPEKAAVHDGRDISRAQALRVYEHGRVEWNKRTPDALQAALSSFTEAARRDTTLPQAYSGIADAYAMLAWYGVMPSLDELQRAQAAAERAISLDPNLAEAHASLGNIYELVDHDETRARAEYSRAIELDGSYVAARDWFAFHLAAHGRIGEALRQMIAARSLAPRSVVIRTDLATMLFWARAYDQSLSELKQVATIDPSYRPMHYLLWRVNAALGKRSEALAALQVVMRDEGYSEPVVRGLRRAYAAGDWTTVLQRRLSAVERPSAHSRRRSIEAAALAVQLGRTDIAAFWLAQAHKEGNVALRFARFDPALDSVRDDPRVREILDVVTRSESKETNATR